MAAITPEELTAVAEAVEAQIPFNRVLGLHVDAFGGGKARMHFTMHESLVGNFARGSLHGGVISAALDVVGGMAALTAEPGEGAFDPVARFSRLGTIDLRVDYLRPGIGERFVAGGHVIRAGSRVAVTRMELHNESDALIAVGTGTYIVG